MADSFTERSSRSWFQRIGGSFAAAGIGILLVLGALVALFINEGRAVKTARALTEGAGLVATVDASRPDPANDRKLVHISGAVTPLGVPRDPQTGIEASGSTGLSRSVEMYQWKEERRSETRTKVGGGEETVTTYSYVRDWSSSSQNSANFRQPAGHENPGFPVNSESFYGDGAKLGGYTLAPDQISGMGSTNAILPDQAMASAIASRFGAGKPARILGDMVVISRNPDQPAVGDLRIRYTATRLDQASFVGMQSGDRIGPYRTSGGRDIFLRQANVASATEMFDSAQASNTALTWMLRIGGLIALFIGFRMIFGFLGTIADVIPLFGRVVRGATGLVALSLSLMLGSIAIALGWIAYRPIVGGAILVVGLGLGYFFWRRGKAKTAALQPA